MVRVGQARRARCHLRNLACHSPICAATTEIDHAEYGFSDPRRHLVGPGIHLRAQCIPTRISSARPRAWTQMGTRRRCRPTQTHLRSNICTITRQRIFGPTTVGTIVSSARPGHRGLLPRCRSTDRKMPDVQRHRQKRPPAPGQAFVRPASSAAAALESGPALTPLTGIGRVRQSTEPPVPEQATRPTSEPGTAR